MANQVKGLGLDLNLLHFGKELAVCYHISLNSYGIYNLLALSLFSLMCPSVFGQHCTYASPSVDQE